MEESDAVLKDSLRQQIKSPNQYERNSQMESDTESVKSYCNRNSRYVYEEQTVPLLQQSKYLITLTDRVTLAIIAGSCRVLQR